MMTRTDKWMFAALVVWLLLLGIFVSGCATTATDRARGKPADIVAELIQFQAAVGDQYQQGGMDVEHFNVVTSWIGDALRVLQTNPAQFEGQARLKWPVVQSIVVPFESLQPFAARITARLQ